MSGDYEVGHGKPPQATRFKKGKSGNPKGRPKGIQNLSTLLEKELNSKIRIREGTKSSEIRKLDAIVKTVVNDAIKGKLPALIWIARNLPEEPLAAEKISRDEAEKEILDILKILNDSRRDQIIDHRSQLEQSGVPEDLIIEATGLDVEEESQRKKRVRKKLLEYEVETCLIDEILGPEDDNEDGKTATGTLG